MTLENIYTMPARNAKAAIAAIEAANRKAARAGIEARIAYAVEYYTEEKTNKLGMAYQVATAAIEITRPEIRINGWIFVGILRMDEEAGIIARAMKGQEIQIRPDALTCDHCHQTRTRHETYVLRHEMSGEIKQIGSGCIAAYLGIEPAGLWMMTWDGIEAAAEADDAEEDDEIRGAGHANRYSTAEVLKVAAGFIRIHGWKSNKTAQETGGTSTAARVLNALRTKSHTAAEDLEIRKILEWMQSDPTLGAEADAARQAAAEIAGWSEYADNMRKLAGARTVTADNIGFLVSAFAILERNRQQAAAAAASTSQHLGQIGERIEIAGATVKTMSLQDGMYGITTVITLTDAAGNALKWYASGAQPYQIGQVVKIKGTVKAHSTRNGINETQLTRCKIS